jgi:hypothetical protein
MTTEDYNVQLAAISAIPHDQIKRPSIPIKAYLQEAEDLQRWSEADKEALLAVGLDWSLVEDLTGRTGALREAESRWFKQRSGREQAQLTWDKKSPAAYDMRDHLLRCMRFAYRGNATLLKQVALITAGRGHVDMIQDLYEIASLGGDHAALLAKVGVSLEQLAQAAITAEAMADLLAEVNGERGRDESKLIRDQAFTYLKAAVDEIRATGQFLFWDDDNRRDGYVSHYARHHRSSRKEDDTAAALELVDAP